MKKFLMVLLYVGLTCASSFSHALPAVKDGDIIFQTSKSAQSRAIQLATHSPYSHMGIVFFRNGKPFVLEASATVRYTPLSDWVARGKDGKSVVKRLRAGVTSQQAESLRLAAQMFLKRSYDPAFEWSDSRIYCSELVWKIYDRGLNIHIGELQQLRDFDLSSPAVLAKMKERYRGAFPLDEKVISPAAMFNSDLLVLVFE